MIAGVGMASDWWRGRVDGRGEGRDKVTVAILSFFRRLIQGLVLAIWTKSSYSVGQADLSVLNIYICNNNFLLEIINKNYGCI